MHPQYPRRVPDTAPIKGHINDFFFDIGLVSAFAVIELKTAFAGFALVSLVASCADTFPADSIRLVAIATKDRNSNYTVQT